MDDAKVDGPAVAEGIGGNWPGVAGVTADGLVDGAADAEALEAEVADAGPDVFLAEIDEPTPAAPEEPEPPGIGRGGLFAVPIRACVSAGASAFVAVLYGLR